MKTWIFLLLVPVIVLQFYLDFLVWRVPLRAHSTIIYQAAPACLDATVTAYTARKCETNHDNRHTATMERPVSGWTCAVSRDLMHWLGGRVYIEGVGVRRVNDLMNGRFEKRVDLFIGTVREARAFGKQTRQVIFLGR